MSSPAQFHGTRIGLLSVLIGVEGLTEVGGLLTGRGCVVHSSPCMHPYMYHVGPVIMVLSTLR